MKRFKAQIKALKTLGVNIRWDIQYLSEANAKNMISHMKNSKVHQNNLTDIFSKFSSEAIEAIYFGHKSKENLKIFTDGIDTIVAENIEEALEIFEKYSGIKYKDLYYYGEDGDEYLKDWSELKYNPDKHLSIFDEDTGKSITKTYKEWIEERGKGLLYTTGF